MLIYWYNTGMIVPNWLSSNVQQYKTIYDSLKVVFIAFIRLNAWRKHLTMQGMIRNVYKRRLLGRVLADVLCIPSYISK